ncbi:DUF397 domain-containing protein [Streptomyces scabiei]|jgi:hypothetical protein|uniref:DUF397 domain-containing protein n=1 Tax=Streptomyces scabiei TaxID=1930 RepID=UPI0029B23D34|nr:DUF397 domain-containing protein [Streptomyces scabiei]MDX3521142.1 DUF397 domain-containing protein [Streptomyces scabiei]
MTTPEIWQKSSFSGFGDGNDCVEVCALPAHLIGLRESDVPASVVTTTTTPLAHLLRAIATGRFT